MELKTRIRMFLHDTGATVTSFCRKVNISPTYFYKYMNNEVEYSVELVNGIQAYLDEVYTKK